MPNEQQRTKVRLGFEQANWMALHSPSKGKTVDLQIQDCAYCGEPALASSIKMVTADAIGQTTTDQTPHTIRVNLVLHLCNRHVAYRRRTRKATSAGSVGLAIGAISYLLLDLFGASNNVPFFQSSNLGFVVLAGIAVIVGCAVLAEFISRIFKLGAGNLPSSVLVKPDDSGNLEYSFYRAECAQQLQTQLATVLETIQQAENAISPILN
jgi:hypothetical protein